MRRMGKLIIVMMALWLWVAPVQSVYADSAASTQASTEESTEQNDENCTEESTTEENTTEEGTTQKTETIKSNYVVSKLSPVKARVVVLDPGHCGTHPGAYGNGMREEVVALAITKACRDYLDSYGGVTVYMTREDGSCCQDLGLGACLVARNNYAKILDADFLVSMHLNAGYTTGANVLAAYQSGYNDEIRVKTQKFGNIALKKLSALGIANRGLLLRKSEANNRYKNGSLADYYSIVRNGVVQKIPSVIIEHGYISSYSDCKQFFNTSAKRKKVGKADGKAIVSYYKLKKNNISGTFKTKKNATYYLNSDGKKVTGWVKHDEKWYYFDPKTAKMQTGFVECDGEKVFLSPTTGEMMVGWFEVDKKTYLAKGNGAIVQGGIYTDGIYTYLFRKNGAQLKKGIHTVNGATYYVDKHRHVVAGVVKVKGKYYGFDEETKQQLFGYQNVNGKYYYFDETTGAAITKAMKKVNGKKYYFGKKGQRTTGWVTYKGNRYYFKEDGRMATGWKKIKGKYYYFSKKNGKMQRNKWIGKYYVNGKGIRTKKR